MLSKSKNINQNIHSLKTKTSKMNTLPMPNEGREGDLKIFNTKEGPGLYGKIRNQWLRFGDGEEVGFRGRRSKKKKLGLATIVAKKLDVLSQINIGKAYMYVTDIDELNIGSDQFTLVTHGNSSMINIGDITLKPYWGSTGATIQ